MVKVMNRDPSFCLPFKGHYGFTSDCRLDSVNGSRIAEFAQNI